jgi:hypothetical protein
MLQTEHLQVQKALHHLDTAVKVYCISLVMVSVSSSQDYIYPRDEYLTFEQLVYKSYKLKPYICYHSEMYHHCCCCIYYLLLNHLLSVTLSQLTLSNPSTTLTYL